MSDPIKLLKLYSGEVIVVVVAILMTSIIAYYVIKKPEKIGLKKKVPKNSYWLIPVPALLIILLALRDKYEGFSYPSDIAVHENTIILNGTLEEIRERPENENITYSEYYPMFYLYNKNTGERIAKFSADPMYARKNKLLAAANMGYDIIDLTTGEVVDILSEDQIKKKLNSFTTEKIHSFAFDGAIFQGRTVMDKHFTYDVLQNEINIESSPLFQRQRPSRSQYEKFETELFKPEIIAETTNGVTLVVSYDDLEKRSFIISAIAPNGSITWTKRDWQISDDLNREPFSYVDMPYNAVTDDASLYFVNREYLVCVDLKDGSTRWITDL